VTVSSAPDFASQEIQNPSMDSAFFPQAKKIYRTVTEFAAGFRLYRRKENTFQ